MANFERFKMSDSLSEVEVDMNDRIELMDENDLFLFLGFRFSRSLATPSMMIVSTFLVFALLVYGLSSNGLDDSEKDFGKVIRRPVIFTRR